MLALTVLMVLALSMLTGGTVLCLCSALQLPISPIQFVYNILEVDSFWMRCNHPVPLAMIVRNIYQTSAGVNDLIKGYIRFLRSPLLMMFIMCHPFTSGLAHMLLVGAIMVGFTGICHFFWGLLWQVRLGGGNWQLQVGMLAMWMTSVGSKALGRLCLVVGCAIATRELYQSLVIRARELSQWIGDRILEPHNAS